MELVLYHGVWYWTTVCGCTTVSGTGTVPRCVVVRRCVVLYHGVYGRCRSHRHHRRVGRSTPIADEQVADPGARQYQPELFGVGLSAQARVDAAAAQQKNLLERRAELAVEPGVDDRVEETVCVTEPQEQGAQPVRDALGLDTERLYQRQHEERQPAGLRITIITCTG